MKAIVLVLLILLVFLGCALFGYQAAGQLNSSQTDDHEPDLSVEFRGEQYNLLLMRVNQLNSLQPRLISIWFVSLFFLEDSPTTLTLAQIYPSNSPSSLSLEQTFAFTAEGEISPAFWEKIEDYGFNWQSYIVVDTVGANFFLQWLTGSGDFTGALEAASGSQENGLRMVEQTCKSISNATDREIGQVNWSDLMPAHFRSNMRLEAGLVYWDRLIDTGPVRCEIIPSP